MGYDIPRSIKHVQYILYKKKSNIKYLQLFDIYFFFFTSLLFFSFCFFFWYYYYYLANFLFWKQSRECWNQFALKWSICIKTKDICIWINYNLWEEGPLLMRMIIQDYDDCVLPMIILMLIMVILATCWCQLRRINIVLFIQIAIPMPDFLKFSSPPPILLLF